MHDSAAHLVDRVFPFIPVRQWVISWPKWLRPYLARHPALASSAQKICLRSVFAWQRRKAKAHGFTDVRTGSVYFSQRAGDSLNLNPHVHAILPDGVFEKTAEQAVAFQKLEKPNDEDVLAILTRIVKRTRRYLELRGILQDAPAADALDELAFSTQCSTRRPPTERRRAPLSAFLEGFSLHAGTHVHQHDRAGLEHLLRYGARPPIALTRLSKSPNGKYAYALKYPLADGSLKLVLDGQQMMARFALLVPRPRVHLIGYAGIFAANSSWRRHIVPASPQPHRSSCTHALGASDEPGVPPPSALPATDPSTRQILVAMTVAAAAIDPTSLSPTVGPASDSYPVHAAPFPRERYLDWASLLRRTFS